MYSYYSIKRTSLNIQKWNFSKACFLMARSHMEQKPALMCIKALFPQLCQPRVTQPSFIFANIKGKNTCLCVSQPIAVFTACCFLSESGLFHPSFFLLPKSLWVLLCLEEPGTLSVALFCLVPSLEGLLPCRRSVHVWSFHLFFIVSL